MFSVEYNILRTLLRHKAGSLQDTVEIQLGSTMLLALRWPLRHQLLGIHLHLVHLDAGEGHPCTFNADRPLYDFKSRADTNKPLHEPEVAAGYGFGRPYPDY